MRTLIGVAALAFGGRLHGLLLAPVLLPPRMPFVDSLRLVTAVAPLVYSGRVHEFRGVLHVGFEDSLDPSGSHRLQAPVALLLSAGGARLTPASVVVEHTNLPFVAVQVAVESPGESLWVHLRTAFNPRGVDVAIPIERPAITLQVVTNGVPGFGLAAAIVHVTLPIEAHTVPRVVRLHARHSTPEPSEVTLAGGETRDARVRSIGIGTDTIYAESAPFRPARIVLSYTWPIHFLVTSLVGGLCGIGLARASAKRRGGHASHPLHLLLGLASGLFVAAAFAVGLNLTGLKIATQYGEAVGVIVAALGAMFGIAGVGRAIPVIGRALRGAV